MATVMPPYGSQAGSPYGQQAAGFQQQLPPGMPGQQLMGLPAMVPGLPGSQLPGQLSADAFAPQPSPQNGVNPFGFPPQPYAPPVGIAATNPFAQQQQYPGVPPAMQAGGIPGGMTNPYGAQTPGMVSGMAYPGGQPVVPVMA
ncbi:MAG: hypothetical protein AAGI66_01485 [Cyanobacteria bacterium P01_H01_bin.74]